MSAAGTDGEFIWQIVCPSCGACYDVGTEIALTKAEQQHDNAKVFDGDDWRE